ncbi:hypothetical protein [Paludibacterium paludis]|uniref:hypothetical protein n=1 Tax=Paludibacterium paludis TaxID=1225769 RepID=UPI003CC818CF
MRFARTNRQLIAQRILARLRGEGTRVIDIDHNMLASATVGNVRGWQHRKGGDTGGSGLSFPVRAAITVIWSSPWRTRSACFPLRMARGANGCAASARTGCPPAIPRNN